MKYAINSTAINLFIKGTNIRVEKSDKRYPKILGVFQLEEDEQEQAVLDILEEKVNSKKVIEETEGFETRVNDYGDEEIWYKGDKLPKAFSDKVLSIIRDGLPLEHFEKFWENLEKNPSAKSVEELIQFLDYKELPITEDGCFLAYKGVNYDYYSSHGNTSTKVLQGTVDASGRILNTIGEVIEVRRRDVDDDREQHCSFGLHAGSLDYARGFASRMVVVKINPADVVSVPSDCSCQKVRVCKYEVVADFVEEIQASVVNEDGEDNVAPNHVKERSAFVEKVYKYLENKRSAGYEEVSIRQIQNSFSPGWATKTSILDALQELGEYFEENEDGLMVVVL